MSIEQKAEGIASFMVQGASQGTFPNGINLAGKIAASYVDANGVGHGFLRTP